MSDTLRARCPAKVNLTLQVLGREADGYHRLDTVFQAVDLWDEIEARSADDLSLSCDTPGVPTDATNLVLRAAEALRRRHPEAPGAEIRLRKSIPAQGGLGGGSSDAAGALLLLSALWGLPPTRDELVEIGRGLGADVPFFLYGGTARGLDRGDRIEPIHFIGERPIVLGLPPFGVPTARVFSRIADVLTLPRNGVNFPFFSAHKWPKEKDFAVLVNDLEAVVFDDWPELAGFRDALERLGARRAMLSGSGSTVYGIFDDRRDLPDALDRLRADYPHWSVVETRAVDASAHVVP